MIATSGIALKPRHVLWREQYRGRRYGRHLTRPELAKRLRDLFLNQLRVMPDGKIGVRPVDDDMAILIEKWTHMLEEMALRYGPYPAGMDRDIIHSEPFPNFASELATKAAMTMSGLGLKPGEVLIKLGKRNYMEALFNEGALRIQPASYFLGSTHNGAIRDDELNISFSLALSRDEIAKLVINPQDVQPDAPEQRIDVNFEYPRDYWLYCLTTSIEPRLFVDFDADACVVIHDRAAFAARLEAAAASALGNPPMRRGQAIYLDPLFPSSTDVFVPLAKYFGYGYQHEYRFCWLPQGTGNLEHRDLRIGSIADIARLVTL